MALRRNRKGMFFTLISILIITMFVVYFRMQADIPLKSRVSVAESRITSMNDFVRSFEEVYVPRALYATSHRALGAITRYITWKNNNRGDGDDTKYFVPDISEAFRTAVNESFIYDHEEDDDIVLPEMMDKNIIYWLNKLSDVAREEMNMELDVNVTDLYIEQDYETGAWRVRVVLEMNYLVETEGIASWRREKKGDEAIIVEFGIAGFIDPYIAAMTNGTLNRSINRNKLATDQINTQEDFISLLSEGNYTSENYVAPSFLMRFEGDTTPSLCCGIESFVYPGIVYINYDVNGDPYPDVLDEDDYGNSYLDFQFWRGRCYGVEYEEDVVILLLDSTLYIPDSIIYPDYDYLKIDSYHRYNVYPNIDPGNINPAYLTIEQYNQKHSAIDPEFVDVSPSPKCTPTYPNCDGCT